MREFRAFIPGPPIPWSRPRADGRGQANGKPRFFRKTALKNFQDAVQMVARVARKAQPLMTGSLVFEAWVYLERAPSIPKKRRFPCVRPDWDNFAKGVADALNGIWYEDDGAIVDGLVHKRYAQTANDVGILFTVREKQDDEQ